MTQELGTKEIEEFRFRLKSIGSIEHHDIQWKEVFRFYNLKWEEWWDGYCEGLHNLVGSFIEDENSKTELRAFPSIFDEKVEYLFIKWLYTGEKKYLQPFYDWFKEYMKRKKRAREEEAEMEKLQRLEEEKWKKENPNSGYIYLIKAGRYYKIGKSKRLGDRIQTHQTSNPSEVRLITEKWTKDYHLIEQRLHKMFEQKKIKGEWFELDRDDIKTVKSFLKTKEIKI